MQLNKILNIMFFIKNINRLIVLLTKVFRRIFDKKGRINKNKNIKFIKENLSSLNDFLVQTDEKIYLESLEFSKQLHKDSKKKLNLISHELGGGGAYILLYFITRYTKPKNILETGVAAGFSSQSFLKAISANSNGTLYSSDFPYFRLKKPEKYIGILVDENLKKNWNLRVEGDIKNIKNFIKIIVGKINFFHYDSDKTYNGRSRIFKLLDLKIDNNTNIIIDDIQDNSFFFDYINKKKLNNWRIFEFEKKFLGLIIGDKFYKN